MTKSDPGNKPRLDFEASKDLRTLFSQQFELWKKKNYGGIDELSRRCGVSNQYLSQVARYGRIPGRPVLILLALNFDMPNPERFFEAAGVKDPWVYEDNIRLGKISQNDSGFVSLKIDMDGFSTAIREIVKSEIRPRNISERIGKRPLRIGLYVSYNWLYDKPPVVGEPVPSGILSDFCRLLGVSLQREVSMQFVPFARHIEELEKGNIDLYGPMMFSHQSSSDILFTNPLQKVGLSILMRKKPSKDLIDLPTPTSIQDLINKPYKIAVLKDSLPKLIASTKLQRSEEELIVVDTDEEAIDRMLVRGVKRPAHFYLANSLILHDLALKYRRDLELLFDTKETLLDMTEIAFGVRPDFGDLLPQLNKAITFLLDHGGFRDRIHQRLTGELGILAGLTQ